MFPDVEVYVTRCKVEDDKPGFFVELRDDKYWNCYFSKKYVPEELPDEVVDVMGLVCGEVAVKMCKKVFSGPAWMDKTYKEHSAL
jgi:hypothetical protein